MQLGEDPTHAERHHRPGARLHVGVKRLDLRRHVDVPVQQALHGRRAEQLRQVPARLHDTKKGSAILGVPVCASNAVDKPCRPWQAPNTTSEWARQKRRVCRAGTACQASRVVGKCQV